MKPVHCGLRFPDQTQPKAKKERLEHTSLAGAVYASGELQDCGKKQPVWSGDSAEPAADRLRERGQVAESIPEHVFDDVEVDGVVSVDEDVPKAGHLAQVHSQRSRDPSATLEERKELAVRAGLSQSLVGHDVGGRVEHCLDRHLERASDEALLFDVAPDSLRPSQRPQLLNVRLDLRQASWRAARDPSHGGPGHSPVPAKDGKEVEVLVPGGDLEANAPRAIRLVDQLSVPQDAMGEVGGRGVEHDRLHG